MQVGEDVEPGTLFEPPVRITELPAPEFADLLMSEYDAADVSFVCIIWIRIINVLSEKAEVGEKAGELLIREATHTND